MTNVFSFPKIHKHAKIQREYRVKEYQSFIKWTSIKLYNILTTRLLIIKSQSLITNNNSWPKQMIIINRKYFAFSIWRNIVIRFPYFRRWRVNWYCARDSGVKGLTYGLGLGFKTHISLIGLRKKKVFQGKFILNASSFMLFLGQCLSYLTDFSLSPSVRLKLHLQIKIFLKSVLCKRKKK